MAVADFLTSGAGLVLATTFHMLGAILYLTGIAAYLVWYRGLHGVGRKGSHRPEVLQLAGFLVVVAIVLQLVGGFMRTWQPEHPSWTDFGHQPWATAMVIKHVFLFIGYAAAWFLFRRVAPRLVRRFEAGDLPARARDHGLAASVVAVSIVVASLLGAVAQASPILHDTPPTDSTTVEHTASGVLTSTPVAPRSQTGTFDVPANATLLEATLRWDSDEFDLSLTLVPPQGQPVAGDPQEVTIDHPAVGRWTYRITASLAVDVPWELAVVVHVGGH